MNLNQTASTKPGAVQLVVLSGVQFIFSSLDQGTGNIFQWPPADFVLFGVYVVTSLGVVSADWLYGRSTRSGEEIIGGVCDLQEYVRGEKGIVDCLLAHYGHLGAIGIMLGTMIFSLRLHVGTIPKEAFVLPITLLLLSVSVLYAFIACKWFYGLRRLYTAWVATVIALAVLLIDIQAIGYVIASVPK